MTQKYSPPSISLTLYKVVKSTVERQLLSQFSLLSRGLNHITYWVLQGFWLSSDSQSANSGPLQRFGCLAIWLFGCLTVWLFGYLAIWLFGCGIVRNC